MNRIFKACLFVLFAATSQLFAIEITGHVVNGTLNEKPVGQQEVQLYQTKTAQEEAKVILKATTDKKGKYRFSVSDSLFGKSFYPTAMFKGVEYYGEVVQAKDKQKKLVSDITVFEPTDSDSNIIINMEHLLITPAQGKLFIKDIFLVQNIGKSTFMGKRQIATDKFATLTFQMPDGFEDISVGGDLMQCCAVIQGNNVYETMPIKPGMRQELISYSLAYKKNSYVLQKVAEYVILQLDILVPDTTVRIEAAGLEKLGNLAIRNVNYAHYRLKGIKAGLPVSIALSNLPGGQRSYNQLSLIGLGVVLFGFLLFAVLRKRRGEEGQEKTSGSQKDRRQTLIEKIARLDDLWEAGKIEEETYKQQRTALKEELYRVSG